MEKISGQKKSWMDLCSEIGDQSSVCGCRWMNSLVFSVCRILDSFFIFWKCCQNIPVSTGIAVEKKNDQRKDWKCQSQQKQNCQNNDGNDETSDACVAATVLNLQFFVVQILVHQKSCLFPSDLDCLWLDHFLVVKASQELRQVFDEINFYLINQSMF